MTDTTYTQAQILQLQLTAAQNQLALVDASNTAAISQQAMQYAQQITQLQTQVTTLTTQLANAQS